MSEIKGQGGELRATITVTRKATGKVETYELVGEATIEQARALGATIVGQARHNRNHGASGAVVGQGAKLSNEE